MISILVVGAGGHAKTCIDVIEQEGRFVISGLIGQQSEVGTTVLGCNVTGTDSDLCVQDRQGKKVYALVAVGQIKTPNVRKQLFSLLEQHGYHMPTIVSPHAYVSPYAVLGSGTIIMHGAIVNAGVKIGENCIVNSRALIEHDVEIGDHCHISTGSIVNGNVFVGEGTFVGSGTEVRQGVSIGKNCVIGMGQRILANCADGSQVPKVENVL